MDAKERYTLIPPALVQEIAEDPSKLQPVARAMSAVMIERLFKEAANPNNSLRDKIELTRTLLKLAGVDHLGDPDAGESKGPTFSVTINIPGAAPVTTNAVIEGQAVNRALVDENAE